jgi:hypothetical protein
MIHLLEDAKQAKACTLNSSFSFALIPIEQALEQAKACTLNSCFSFALIRSSAPWEQAKACTLNSSLYSELMGSAGPTKADCRAKMVTKSQETSDRRNTSPIPHQAETTL